MIRMKKLLNYLDIKLIKIMKKELIDLFEKLGFGAIVIDDNANITSVKEAIAYGKLRTMIDDAHESTNNINYRKCTDDDIANISIVLINATKFDDDDIKIATVDDLKKFATALDNANNIFNKLANAKLKILAEAIRNKQAEEKKKDTDNLEDLSKEELIARLREKMK